MSKEKIKTYYYTIDHELNNYEDDLYRVINKDIYVYEISNSKVKQILSLNIKLEDNTEEEIKKCLDNCKLIEI